MAKTGHRIGTDNTAGAPVISTTQFSVYFNDQLAATDGSPVMPHGPGVHATPVTANGSDTVFFENIRVNREGDPDSCGHPRDFGCFDVYVGP